MGRTRGAENGNKPGGVPVVSNHDLIKAAVDALGQAKGDDYKIEPTRHATALENRAPGLVEILESSHVHVAARQYEEQDENAIEAQRRFKQLAFRSRLAVLGTVCIGAALMLFGSLSEGNGFAAQKWLFLVLALAGIIVGALGTMWIFRIREGKLLDKWTTSRARSENQRLHYFDTVTRPGDVCENPSPTVLLQQLEYFRRYQLDVQVLFFKIRGAEHLASSRRTLTLSSWAVFLSMVATGAAGVLAAWWTPLASIAGLAVLGTGLSSYASSKEAVNQDRHNAERYAKAREALERIESRLHEVRQAVAAGKREALDDFVDAVHEQLSLEHRQWLSSAEAMSKGISTLEKTLERLKDKGDPGGAAGPATGG
jgi:hypothetical protein